MQCSSLLLVGAPFCVWCSRTFLGDKPGYRYSDEGPDVPPAEGGERLSERDRNSITRDKKSVSQPFCLMADYHTRMFRVHLTTAMESILTTALIEISKIFESSIHGHQMELAQKGEEIALLKIKLQRAELKLKESQDDCDGREEMDQIQITATQIEPENASRQSPQPPEIYYEVPDDDWCAPVGCENVAKQYDDVCPSVRLRRLSIALRPIPVIKQEVTNCDINSHQSKKATRKSKNGSSVKESHKHTQDKSLPLIRTQCPPVRNDMKQLLRELDQEYSGSATTTRCRRRGTDSTGKQEHFTRCKRKGRKNIANKSVPKPKKTVENGVKAKVYCCNLCHKIFDTEFGRSVHMRSHKKCQKSRTEKSCDQKETSMSTLNEERELLEKKSSRSSDSCKVSARSHKDQIKSKQTNRDLGWTKPLEESEASGEGLISLSKEASGAAKYNRVKIEGSRDTSPRWQTMGARCSDGCNCITCLKLIKSKGILKEHFCIHTGERPIKCDNCPKQFRSRTQLYKHKQRYCVHLKNILCKQCGKNFASRRELNRHVYDFHRDWPNICQKCGKGFLSEGHLNNHMHRFHK